MELPNRPLNAKEIAEEAERFNFNTNIPLKQYAMAAETLYREGMNYLSEDNYGKAYLLLLRHSYLVFNHLPSHPDAKNDDGRRLMKKLRRRMPDVLQTLEDIKPYINAAYDEWIRMTADRRGLNRDQLFDTDSSSHQNQARRDAALSWNPNVQARILDAGDHQDLAVELATKEIRRRRARHGGISDKEEQERRAGWVWDQPPDSGTGVPRSSAYDDVDLQRSMESARRRLDFPNEDEYSGSSRDYAYERPVHTSTAYQYPSISRSSAVSYEGNVERHRSGPLMAPPPRPAKESFPSYSEHPPPPRPQKELYLTERRPESASGRIVYDERQNPPQRPPKTADASVPAKTQRYTFRPGGYLENGEPIRTVFLPSTLRHTFLRLAADNTRRNLEMCGILCGSLVNNAFFISCLLIPEQECTSDTCETTNEGTVFEYCEQNDLMVIGWIHTHPTQTCFMSSRDLHTQSGYQIMMPESIAIVCAPRQDPDWGIFRLTNPPGLPHLLQCRQPGIFHQHEIDNLYTSAGHPPGHVYEASALSFYVHDLRFKS